MKTHAVSVSIVAGIMAASLVAAASVYAGATIKLSDSKWISIGAGMRTSFETKDKGAPNNTDDSREAELESIRLYVNGQIHKNIKFTFNTERKSDGDIRVIDGIAQFKFSNIFNFWMGRFLPPSDRSNLSGSYNITTWEFPLVQKYPALAVGRDDGFAIWGQTDNKKFKYQAGFFQGRDGDSNQKDNLLFAWRVSYNFWDPEPGYYNNSTYHGKKNILAIGLVQMTQSDGVGIAATPGDFTGTSIDFLFEKKLKNGGALTVEAAHYDYDLNNVADDPVRPVPLKQGDGQFVLAAYLFPKKSGLGRFQPHIRYQKFDEDNVGETERTDIGVNYIIDGHSARVSLVYGDEDAPGTANDFKTFKIGVQLQF